MTCPNCGSRMQTVKTMPTRALTVRLCICGCGEECETTEQVSWRRLRPSGPNVAGGHMQLLMDTGNHGQLLAMSGSDLGSGSSPDQIRIPLSNSGEVVRKRRKTPASEAFDRFWAIYPRRVKRKKAIKVWQDEGLDAKADEVIRGLTAQLPFFSRCAMDKIPHPTSWLNDARWTDEPKAYDKNAPPGANGSVIRAQAKAAAISSAFDTPWED